VHRKDFCALLNFLFIKELLIYVFLKWETLVLLAGVLALTIALLTVSWQAIRAATANPVESLRYE